VLQERDEEQAEAEPLRTQPLPLWLRPIVATAILAPLAIAIFVDHFGVSDIILVFTTLLLAQQPKQNVFGADVVVLESASLFLCQDDHSPGSLCKTLKHET
jgi:hypothetical protein